MSCFFYRMLIDFKKTIKLGTLLLITEKYFFYYKDFLEFIQKNEGPKSKVIKKEQNSLLLRSVGK